MERLLTFTGAVRRDPAIDDWLNSKPDDLSALVRPWFARMRGCGDDVRELMHDGCPTACVGDAAFAYVGIYTAHANVGFFLGAELKDPARLLEGTGKRMRHVKLRPATPRDPTALGALIDAAYADMKRRLAKV